MAGVYPNVPGYRFAYDEDGTIVTAFASQAGNGQVFTLTQGELTTINQNQQGSVVPYYSKVGSSNPYFAFIFPELRSISGYFLSCNVNGVGIGRLLQTSTDTLTGQDGTWNTVANPYSYIAYNNTAVSPSYRSAIASITANNIKAIRFVVSDQLMAFHLYGSIATTQSPDRLRIIDLSNNDIAAQLDFGDIPQRNNATQQFKVVNNSSTKIANNITLTLETNPDASPTLIGQYQLSTDNSAYANAINIGTLAPGASSGTLYVRNTVSSTAQLGPWCIRLVASANTWS